MTSTAAGEDDPPANKSLYRLLTLFCLCFVDGTYTVLRRYSRGIRKENYNVNELLLMSEIFKLIFSLYMVSNKTTNNKTGNGSLGLLTYLLELVNKSHKMLVLAIIYGVGNIMSYYALARVGAGTFVVFAQGKTLTTAMFSALMLGRTYSWTKVRALLTLVAGVILFVLPTLDNTANNNNLSATSSSEVVKGCLAQGFCIVISGFACIYFEKAIKNDAASEGLDIWDRNVQLGLYSILVYVSLLVGNPSGAIFHNWTPLACILSVMGAGGGLLVALSIKYGDSVLKTFAISGSIIYAAIVDRFFLSGPLTFQMGISAGIVVLATVSYTFDATPTTGDTQSAAAAHAEPTTNENSLSLGKKDEQVGLLEVDVEMEASSGVEGSERRLLSPKTTTFTDVDL